MIGKFKGASAEVVWDDDTPETIMQKLNRARYLIDMRSDITDPLEDIVRRYYIEQKKIQKQEQEQEQQQQEPIKPERRFF